MVAASIAATLCGVGAPARATGLETAIEATYLYKFAPFVDWPAGSGAARPTGLTICIVGDDPFGDTLDRAVAGERIADRPVSLRRLPTATAKPACDIMFVAGSPRQSVAEALTAVAGAPVLTVTDHGHNGGPPGIVDFVVQNDRVRFAIDDDTAKRNGLRISSKLLSLAIGVKR